MTEHHDAASTPTPRERELQLEVGRLQAELETLRGEDPAMATSRFLAMAAATADLAVAEAHREADEIVEEVSAQAEARRDEATRVAAEAEALAEEMLTEADRSQERIDEATEEADSIRAVAKADASNMAALEREKIMGEIAELTDARETLETERDALESYHETLRRRVQDFAESMVSFMAGESELASSVTPQLVAVLADKNDEDVSADDASRVEGSEEIEASVAAAGDQIVDVPDASIDEIPEGPVMTFGGVPVIEEVESSDEGDVDGETRAVADDTGETRAVAAEDDAAEDDATEDALKSSSAGLFSRASVDETRFDDLAAVGAEEENDDTSLFGALGARLVAQTSPADLADALDEDRNDDQAFREFIDGDDEPDPSRDWLLRPESS